MTEPKKPLELNFDQLREAIAKDKNVEITPNHKIIIVEDDESLTALAKEQLIKTFGSNIVIINQKELTEKTKEALPSSIIDDTLLRKPFPIQTLIVNDYPSGDGKTRRRRRRSGK